MRGPRFTTTFMSSPRPRRPQPEPRSSTRRRPRPPLPEGTVRAARRTRRDLGPRRCPRRCPTVVTYDTWAAGRAGRADVVAASFRRYCLVAGVAIERYTEPPPAGTPWSREEATPLAPDPEQEQLATTLATTLDERITTVLAGQTPAGSIPRSPRSCSRSTNWPMSRLRSSAGTKPASRTPAGLHSAARRTRSSPSPTRRAVGSTAAASCSRRGGRRAAATLCLAGRHGVHLPGEAALEVLEAIRQVPELRTDASPRSPRGHKTLVDHPAIPEAHGGPCLPCHADEDPTTPADGAGVDFVVGDRLVTVDVQGIVSRG